MLVELGGFKRGRSLKTPPKGETKRTSLTGRLTFRNQEGSHLISARILTKLEWLSSGYIESATRPASRGAPDQSADQETRWSLIKSIG